MMDNTGTLPGMAKGKRVRGILRNGQRFGFEPVSPVTPAGWPADGFGGCDWKLKDHPFDIVKWELVS